MKFFPTRSHVDDIDTSLNALEPHHPASDEAVTVLETHRNAMSAIRSDPAATGPAAGTWNRVLRETARPNAKGQHEMSATATFSTIAAGNFGWTKAKSGSRVAHSMNIAAALVVIAAIVAGGWFATTQNDQLPDPLPRFAAMGLQIDDPGNGVCDVAPLSVDEAIMILNDPLGSLTSDLETPPPDMYVSGMFDRRSIQTPNVYYNMSNVYSMDTMSIDMISGDFDDAQPIVDEYLDCMFYGTVGQEWRLMDPTSVQYRLAVSLPTLASEQEARNLLPDILGQSGTFGGSSSVSGLQTSRMRLNPDDAQTRYLAGTGYPGFSGFAIGPVQYLNPDGSLEMEADLHGNAIGKPDSRAEYSMNVIFAQSPLNQEWYVIDTFFPFEMSVWE